MQHRKPIKPFVFLFVVALAAIGCGLPTSFGGDASGSETATAKSERATELAESINDLESQIEATEQAEQQGMDATATQIIEQKATAKSEAATANAIVEGTATRVVEGTATQEAVENADATATSEVIQPTLESIADEPAIPEGYSLVFFETFDDNSHNWPISSSRDEFGSGVFTIEDGYMECSFDSDRGVHWHLVPQMDRLKTFYMSVDVQRIGGAADGYYGVVFRHVTNDKFYTFLIDDLNQIYWVSAMVDGTWYFVFSGVSGAIEYNGVNRLAVAGEGGLFTFYVNGYRLGQTYDDRYENGTIGLSIDLPGPNNEATWRFDNLAVYAP